MHLRSVLLPMCILLRSSRSNILLRASAFATTPPIPSSSSSSARTRATTTAIFSSTQDKISSIPTNVENYLPITGLQQPKAFGGLTYVETAEDLQRVVFVLGGPGSGKGTQSDLILQEYPCVHLSAGQLLRDETTKKDSPHAQMIEECLVAGKIVPVEISLALLEQAMREAPGKQLLFLVDGFPRNFDNLSGWTARMPSIASVSGVLHYDCPLEVLEKRIMERAKESGRSDDNLTSLRKRFQTFQKDTMPVVEILKEVATLTCMSVFDIPANRPIPQVWEDTKMALNTVIANDVMAQNWKLLEAISAQDTERYTALCSPEMMTMMDDQQQQHQQHSDPKEFLKTQELLSSEEEPQWNCISNAELQFVSGTKVIVSYDRMFGGSTFRETRVWSHTMDGWKMVHFFRSPPQENMDDQADI